jgi:hypothetical protein
MNENESIYKTILSNSSLLFFCVGTVFILIASLQTLTFSKFHFSIGKSKWNRLVLYSVGFTLFLTSLILILSGKSDNILEPAKFPNSGSRISALNGRWKGNNIQAFNGEVSKIPLSMLLNIKQSKVSGEIEILLPDIKDSDRKFNASGNFYADRYLQLQYLNKNGKLYSFGDYLLELSANGSELSGKFIGFGAESNKIIAGEIFYKKEN